MVILSDKNYSRKNFSYTKNEEVKFINCKFTETDFSKANFNNCKFDSCNFSNIEINNVIFNDVVFDNCSFNNIIFNNCKFYNTYFNNCKFYIIINYLSNIIPKGLKAAEITNEYDKYKLENLYLLLISNKFIRESNTLFKKKKQYWSKEKKRSLKKLKAKDSKKLGLSVKQIREENKKRKINRNKAQLEDYENSKNGKNRTLNQAISSFLITKYKIHELEAGLIYAHKNIKSDFSTFSKLLRVIENGIHLSS